VANESDGKVGAVSVCGRLG